MNPSEAIKALNHTHHGHNWHGPVLGRNTVSDFVTGAGAYTPADEVAGAIRKAVKNRIATALGGRTGPPDETWAAWCRGEIEADFSDIQAIIEDIS